MKFLYVILSVVSIFFLFYTITYLINVYYFYKEGRIFFKKASHYLEYLAQKELADNPEEVKEQ